LTALSIFVEFLSESSKILAFEQFFRIPRVSKILSLDLFWLISSKTRVVETLGQSDYLCLNSFGVSSEENFIDVVF
jgi:hypothetical protein